MDASVDACESKCVRVGVRASVSTIVSAYTNVCVSHHALSRIYVSACACVCERACVCV